MRRGSGLSEGQTPKAPGQPEKDAEARAAGEAEPGQANIRAVARLQERMLRGRSGADRAGAGVTRAAGTTVFVGIHVIWFAVWIGANINVVSAVRIFDPYPFNFLTLVVSLEAIFLTLFVLISQNRMSKEADRRTHLDLQVNLLAEEETTKALAMLHRISQHLGLEIPGDDDLHRLSEKTDVVRLARELDRQMPEDK